jgi:hypothetical protein
MRTQRELTQEAAMIRIPRLFFLLLLFSSSLLQAQFSPYFLKIEPYGDQSQPVVVEIGKTIHFIARGYEQASPMGPVREIPVSNITWSVTPALLGTISQNGDFAAGNPTNASNLQGIITAHAQAVGLTLQASVVVTITRTPTQYTISGIVDDKNGNPLRGALVAAEDVIRMSPIALRYSTMSGSDGKYVLKLPASSYIVQASASGFLPEYYDNAVSRDSATAVTINSSSPNATGIDFSLGEGGVISGRVIKAGAGSPIAGAWVSVIVTRGSTPIEPANSVTKQFITDSSGLYRITGLATGEYIVAAGKTGFAVQYYNKKSTAGLADKVQVTLGQTTSNIDFELGPLPGISGTVTRADSANMPIPGAQITADGPANVHYFAYADKAGAYKLALPAGVYRIRASAATYATEWYNEKSDPLLADSVVVSATGNVSGIDFTLERWGGKISGTVRDNAANPIAGAVVRISGLQATTNPASNAVRVHISAMSRSDGTYEIDGVPPGSYVAGTSAKGYLAEFYDNAATYASATPVVVVNHQNTAGIDFSLAQGGKIAGRVTATATGQPIPHAFVTVRNKTNLSEMAARTDSNGYYVLPGLPSGSYVLFAAGFRFIGEYYDNTRDPLAATAVNVTAPATTTGIDFALDSMPSGRIRFAGRVTSAASSLPAEWAIIEAINPQTDACIATSTDPDGNYELQGDASCIVRARALGFGGEYAGQTRNWMESNTAGASGTLDFDLEPVVENGFRSLRGNVRDGDSKTGISNAWVYGIDEDGNLHFACTDANGDFDLSGAGDGVMDVSISGVSYVSLRNSVTLGGNSGSVVFSLRRTDATLDVKNQALPKQVALSQNFPNPFNPSTSITYAIPSSGNVRITVYNLLGAAVTTLVNEKKEAGTHTVTLSAAGMPSGVYIYKLETGSVTLTKRMILMK